MKRYVGLILVGLLLLTACEVEIRRVQIDVTPEEVTLAPGGTQDFTASTTSERETDFSWRADGGRFDNSVGETITYSAPEEEGEYTVRARPTNGGNDFIEGRATVTVSLTEEVEPVTANTDASTPVGDEVALEPDEIIVFEVDVPSSVAQSGQALHLELNQELALSVYDGEGDLYATSSSAALFAAGTAGLETTQDDLAPQAIAVARQCRGSCVIQDAVEGTYYAKIKNTGDARVSLNLYAYILDYSDTEEPGNNEVSGAPNVSDFESGAIESLGDVDLFRADTNGDLIFSPKADISVDLQAELVTATGSTIVEVNPDEPTEVRAGDFIKVSVPDGDEAAAASDSRYNLEIVQP